MNDKSGRCVEPSEHYNKMSGVEPRSYCSTSTASYHQRSKLEVVARWKKKSKSQITRCWRNDSALEKKPEPRIGEDLTLPRSGFYFFTSLKFFFFFWLHYQSDSILFFFPLLCGGSDCSSKEQPSGKAAAQLGNGSEQKKGKEGANWASWEPTWC